MTKKDEKACIVLFQSELENVLVAMVLKTSTAPADPPRVVATSTTAS